MPAGFDLEARLIGELRARPATLGGPVCMACCDIDAGDRFGGGRDLRCRSDGERGQFFGMRRFGRKRVAAGLDDPASPRREARAS